MGHQIVEIADSYHGLNSVRVQPGFTVRRESSMVQCLNAGVECLVELLSTHHVSRGAMT
jgi:hypothetical protein